MRVTWSVEPPAAQGTMRLIGRVGFHCCAWPVPATVMPMATATRVFRNVRVFMSVVLRSGGWLGRG